MNRLKMKDQHGFTLVEMAFVVLIVSIMILGISQHYGAFQVKEASDNNTETLVTVYDQISEFQSENGRLPCPASLTAAPGDANYGDETNCGDTSVVSGACAAGNAYCVQQSPRFAGNVALERVRIGAIPHDILSMDEGDVYDSKQNKIYYAVMESLTDAAVFRETLGGIQLSDDQGNVLDSQAPYILFSTGDNEIGAYSLTGVPRQACAGSVAEVENCDFLTGVPAASFLFTARSDIANATANDDLFQKETYANNDSQIGWVRNGDLTGNPGSNDVVILNRDVRLGIDPTPPVAGVLPTPLTAQATLHLGEVQNDLGNLVVTGNVQTDEYCGLDAAGVEKCFNLADLSTGVCPDGQYVTGIRAGQITCGTLYFGCSGGQILVGKHPDGDLANPDAGRPICVEPAGRVPVAAVVTPTTPSTPTTPTPSTPGTPGGPVSAPNTCNPTVPGDCDGICDVTILGDCIGRCDAGLSVAECGGEGGSDGSDGDESEVPSDVDPQTCLPAVNFDCHSCSTRTLVEEDANSCEQGVNYRVFKSIQLCETFGGDEVRLGDPIPTGDDDFNAGCCTLEPVSNEVRDGGTCGPNFNNSSASYEVRQTLDIQACDYISQPGTQDYSNCGGCANADRDISDAACPQSNIAGAMVTRRETFDVANLCVPTIVRDESACGCVRPGETGYDGTPYPLSDPGVVNQVYYSGGFLRRKISCGVGQDGFRFQRRVWNPGQCQASGNYMDVSNTCSCSQATIEAAAAEQAANPLTGNLGCGPGGEGEVRRNREFNAGTCEWEEGGIAVSTCTPRLDEVISENVTSLSRHSCASHESLEVCGKDTYTQSYQCINGSAGGCVPIPVTTTERQANFVSGTCRPAQGRLVAQGSAEATTDFPGDLAGSTCELTASAGVRTCSVPSGADRWQTFVCECSQGAQPPCTPQ